MKKLNPVEKLVIFGCDPEFFIAKDNEIIGSEKVLPKDGLVANSLGGNPENKIIIDGVQAELNPSPRACRELLAQEIARCFSALDTQLQKDPTLSASFKQTIEVSKEEFDTLSDDSKKFGCAPSKNLYHKKASIKADPSKYMTRSAGGHIHLGANDSTAILKILRNTKRTIPMLDILVGNTCVLIDRDEGNIERRKNYGRAGEHRLPKHGLEYRTLSNFWLRDYRLMSFVMGLSRMAVAIVNEGLDEEFRSRVNMKKIEKAINTNNFTLAYENFLAIEPVLSEITNSKSHKYSSPLNASNIYLFKFFVEKGLNHWFKEDPLKHWVNVNAGNRPAGWESFLDTTVSAEYKKCS